MKPSNNMTISEAIWYILTRCYRNYPQLNKMIEDKGYIIEHDVEYPRQKKYTYAVRNPHTGKVIRNNSDGLSTRRRKKSKNITYGVMLLPNRDFYYGGPDRDDIRTSNFCIDSESRIAGDWFEKFLDTPINKTYIDTIKARYHSNDKVRIKYWDLIDAKEDIARATKNINSEQQKLQKIVNDTTKYLVSETSYKKQREYDLEKIRASYFKNKGA